MKSSTKFLLGLGIVFLLLFLVEYSQDEPIDWSPGFGKLEKKPYGNYLLFELLPELFKDQKIETINNSIVDQMNEVTLSQSTGINYVFISENLDFNPYETEAILDFVKNGNYLFLAATTFSDTFAKTLDIKQKNLDDNPFYSYRDSLFHFNYCDRFKSSDTGYVVNNEYSQVNTYFDSIRFEKKMLVADSMHRCLMTEINYGEGRIIMCTMPFAFTNYYMLKPANLDFVTKAFTRMPVQNVWWDEHYKSGLSAETPTRYIMSKKGLRWAYYLAIIGIVLFVLFMGKRRQRIIPLQDPMKNSSLEFAETVGQVYYERGDHHNLALKKIKYFMEYLRAVYYVNPVHELQRDRAAFIEHLCQKSGKPAKELKSLFSFILYIENADTINEKELIQLNALIEKFKKTTNN